MNRVQSIYSFTDYKLILWPVVFFLYNKWDLNTLPKINNEMFTILMDTNTLRSYRNYNIIINTNIMALICLCFSEIIIIDNIPPVSVGIVQSLLLQDIG